MHLVSAVLMGHGERPSWVLSWAATAWAGFVLVYYFGEGTALGAGHSFRHLQEAIYLSSIAFVSWTPPSESFSVPSWARGVGLAEAFIAYILLALFLVTFVRKVSPR